LGKKEWGGGGKKHRGLGNKKKGWRRGKKTTKNLVAMGAGESAGEKSNGET